jgi:hypothetical protein
MPLTFTHSPDCDDLMVGRYVRRVRDTDPDHLLGTAAYTTEQGLWWRGKCDCGNRKLKAVDTELATARRAQRYAFNASRITVIQDLITQRAAIRAELEGTK